MGAGTARLLEGGPIADEIRTAVAEDVASFTEAIGRPPGLAVVIVGRDAPSTVYLERILRGCAKVGIHAAFVELEGEATEASVVSTIRRLTASSSRCRCRPRSAFARWSTPSIPPRTSTASTR
jgi:methylenetetrahydrofolate dehydrogenase (NADP+) / methenyltetrahydrofolate cyclohydrolase